MMAEPTQYTFDLREATEALIKQQGLHDGQWVLAFEINFTAGTFGPAVAESKPGAMMQIMSLQLIRYTSSVADPRAVDAAIVNPSKN
jgi:hypothetical protein